ncbi:SPOR domain-containing protein [Rosettibacter firmus]|uniref:SPOR domain-containing protein n=1 Tax=Rosettibacter firmus TaxID=3111522 RepID=UPI00336BC248
MIKNFFYIVLFLFLYFNTDAQVLSKKWMKVINFDDREIFIDTSNLSQEKNIISALIITCYKKPTILTPLNKEIIYIKTQSLFDIDSKKVTIIGNLYYDKELKIISEPFKPLQIVSENNTHLIDTSKIYSTIFDSCLSYIKRNPERINNVNIQKTQITEQANKIENKTDVSTQENEQSSGKPEIESEEYNFENERVVYKTIFTDGNKYCIQISSWKEEYKAQNEVDKLKSKGHNAFYIKVNIPGKGDWYRVRIGYFSTLREAEEYLKEMR